MPTKNQRKTPAQKKAIGTFDRRFTVTNPIQFDKVEDIEPPDSIKYDSIRYGLFIAVKDELKSKGMLVRIDMEMIFAYVEQMSVYYDQMKFIQAEGFVLEQDTMLGVKKVPNPRVAIANEALKIALKIGQQFGITPYARARIPQVGIVEDNPAESLFNAKF